MRCFVPFCKNTTDDVSPSARKRISFHALPSDARLRAAWLRALGKQDGHLPDSAVVCSQHFLDDDIYETENGLRQICIGAIPSIVQVCMICLDTDSKLFLMSKHKLEEAYEKLIGHPVFDQGNLKHTLCVQCTQRLINFSRFRDKSLRSRALMMNLVKKHELITRNHIKMINHTENQLKSNSEVTMLGPDHCDLYILEDASEDKQTESFPSHSTTTLCTEATVVKNEEMYDSPAEEDMEIANEDDNNADSISDEFVVSNEHLLSNSIMAETMDPLKCEILTLECTLCSEEFVGEHAYMQHMHMHGQNSDGDTDCGTSQLCKPHTDPSHLTENKYTIQELNHGPSCSALDQQTSFAPLSARLVTNTENNVQAEEADTIQKSIQQINNEELNSQSFDLTNINRLTNCVVKLYDVFKVPKKSVPIQDELLAEIRTAASCNSQCHSQCEVVSQNDVIRHTKKYIEPVTNKVKVSKRVVLKTSKSEINCSKGDNNWLTCNACNNKFKGKSILAKHMKTHTDIKPFTCKFCQFKTKCKGDLLTHMGTHTVEKSYSCELCDYKCAKSSNLGRHVRTHLGEKPYGCELCGFKTSNKRVLVSHMQTHTGENPNSFELCEHKTARKHSLVLHMKTHTGEKPYGCKLCEYTSARKSDLVTHQRRHTGEKPYTCKFCQYKCTEKSALVRHVRTHTGEKPYPCELCEYKCALKFSLVKHMRTHTGEKPYSCELCEFKCTQKGSLVRHMKTHTGEKPYSCELCEYKCALRFHLVKHMRTHTGEKPYSCTLCEYKFKQKEYLVRHMRTHTGEKPYSCELCKYKCALRFHLVKHMRTHTGEKPYSCKLCEYKFKQKEHLVSHMRTHTDVKPYSCTLCEYKCTQKVHLVRHVRTHTGEKPYSCELCEYKTALKYSLVLHMRTHTGEKPYSCKRIYKCTKKSSSHSPEK